MFARLFAKRPADARSASASPIWAVARAVRQREAARPPEGWPPCSRMVLIRSGRVACSAGKRPKATAVRSATTAANATTR